MQALARTTRPRHHHRALGLSLLSGEGPQASATISSQDEVKPYFELNNMIDGMFLVGRASSTASTSRRSPARSRSGIRTSAPTGHRPRDGQAGRRLLPRHFARTGKRSGAWATTYRSRAGLLGDDIVLGSNNNNFVKPAPGQPVLISLDDAETLFHEFGHAIHYFLSNVHYPSFGGTPRDFVEYPSQVNENWLLTQQVLNRFARHYQTSQPMPAALIEQDREGGDRSTRASRRPNICPRRWSTWRSTCDPTASSIPTRSSARPWRGSACRRSWRCGTGCRSSITSSRPTLIRPAIIPTSGRRRWTPTPGRRSRRAATPGTRRRRDRFASTLLSTGNETDRAEAYRAFRGRDPDVKALIRRRGFPTGN